MPIDSIKLTFLKNWEINMMNTDLHLDQKYGYFKYTSHEIYNCILPKYKNNYNSGINRLQIEYEFI